ncbi:hypothetical protein M422DRAFT_779807 [Sphaerobolus stellatus SS14]|uniref:Uncharacterized protein n=1 Tax=Sphaerobolus stellatus (strain SS14) TaxID=990650 RepID=A0A0C9VXM6_SPHS4|nr:hypothetical protein M422DRAFT_779807 [Sphaerobolus stellatus SS14]
MANIPPPPGNSQLNQSSQAAMPPFSHTLYCSHTSAPYMGVWNSLEFLGDMDVEKQKSVLKRITDVRGTTIEVFRKPHPSCARRSADLAVYFAIETRHIPVTWALTREDQPNLPGQKPPAIIDPSVAIDYYVKVLETIPGVLLDEVNKIIGPFESMPSSGEIQAYLERFRLRRALKNSEESSNSGTASTTPIQSLPVGIPRLVPQVFPSFLDLQRRLDPNFPNSPGSGARPIPSLTPCAIARRAPQATPGNTPPPPSVKRPATSGPNDGYLNNTALTQNQNVPNIPQPPQKRAKHVKNSILSIPQSTIPSQAPVAQFVRGPRQQLYPPYPPFTAFHYPEAFLRGPPVAPKPNAYLHAFQTGLPGMMPPPICRTKRCPLCSGMPQEISDAASLIEHIKRDHTNWQRMILSVKCRDCQKEYASYAGFAHEHFDDQGM